MSNFDWDAWSKHIKETESAERIRSMSPEQLSEHLQFFIAAREYAADDLNTTERGLLRCNERIESLNREIEQRRSDEMHGETIAVGKQNVKWMIIFGIPTLLLAVLALVGIPKCSRSSSTQAEVRPTPTVTPELLPTPTPTQSPTPTPQLSPMATPP